MLIVFGGLPGAGKTTISRALAARHSATYLRVDTIEQALRDALAGTVGPAGYCVANAVAEANLALGNVVIVDCVNPVAASREGWRGVASRASARLIEIEVICSDAVEHRRRVEERASDVQGLVLPTWRDVLERDYEPWDEPHLVIDTAQSGPDSAVAVIEAYIGA
jgi:predicted kinase